MILKYIVLVLNFKKVAIISTASFSLIIAKNGLRKGQIGEFKTLPYFQL
jgi:hypothetical protein